MRKDPDIGLPGIQNQPRPLPVNLPGHTAAPHAAQPEIVHSRIVPSPSPSTSSLPPRPRPRLVLRLGFAGRKELTDPEQHIVADSLHQVMQTLAKRLSSIAPGTPEPPPFKKRKSTIINLCLRLGHPTHRRSRAYRGQSAFLLRP